MVPQVVFQLSEIFKISIGERMKILDSNLD